MPDLYGIVAVCSRPGKEGLYTVAVAGSAQLLPFATAQKFREYLQNRPMPAHVIEFMVVVADEWDRLSVQQALVGGNVWLQGESS